MGFGADRLSRIANQSRKIFFPIQQEQLIATSCSAKRSDAHLALLHFQKFQC